MNFVLLLEVLKFHNVPTQGIKQQLIFPASAFNMVSSSCHGDCANLAPSSLPAAIFPSLFVTASKPFHTQSFCVMSNIATLYTVKVK